MTKQNQTNPLVETVYQLGKDVGDINRRLLNIEQTMHQQAQSEPKTPDAEQNAEQVKTISDINLVLEVLQRFKAFANAEYNVKSHFEKFLSNNLNDYTLDHEQRIRLWGHICQKAWKITRTDDQTEQIVGLEIPKEFQGKYGYILTTGESFGANVEYAFLTETHHIDIWADEVYAYLILPELEDVVEYEELNSFVKLQTV